MESLEKKFFTWALPKKHYKGIHKGMISSLNQEYLRGIAPWIIRLFYFILFVRSNFFIRNYFQSSDLFEYHRNTYSCSTTCILCISSRSQNSLNKTFQQNIPGFRYLPQKRDIIVIDYSRYICEVIVKFIFSLLKVAEHHF